MDMAGHTRGRPARGLAWKMQGIWKDKLASKKQRRRTDKDGKTTRQARGLSASKMKSKLVGGGWPPSVLQYDEPPSRGCQRTAVERVYE